MKQNSPAFHQLKKKWDKKLKDSGFIDRETSNRELIWSCVEQAHQNMGGDRVEVAAIKANYYQNAGQFLYDYKFKKELDRLIWQYHVDGVSTRKISSTLKELKISVADTQVKETIRRLKAIMIKEYIHEQE